MLGRHCENVRPMDLLILTNNPARVSFRQRIVVYLNIVCDNAIDCMVSFFDWGLT